MLDTNVEQAVQEVFRTFGSVGNVALTSEFDSLLNKAFICKRLSETVDNHREHNVLSEQLEAAAKEAKQAFAESYQLFLRRHSLS